MEMVMDSRELEGFPGSQFNISNGFQSLSFIDRALMSPYPARTPRIETHDFSFVQIW